MSILTLRVDGLDYEIVYENLPVVKHFNEKKVCYYSGKEESYNLIKEQIIISSILQNKNKIVNEATLQLVETKAREVLNDGILYCTDCLRKGTKQKLTFFEIETPLKRTG